MSPEVAPEVATETAQLMTLLGEISAKVDQRLRELLPPTTEAPAELHEAMRYSALAPGKRLRPALVLLAAQAVGGNEQAALDAGCALEMIHAFSLIHDDLPALDNDDLRRGLPTCHIKFGEAVALLAGDALFALAFEVLASLPLPAQQVVDILKITAKCVGSEGLVGGETIDILSEGKEVSKETLDQIHLRKTAALIAAACEIGALTAPDPTSSPSTLRTYGESIGLAFQIADDVLNETATAEQLGKAVGSDRERGKATYPALYGLEESRTKALDLAAQASELIQNFPNAPSLRAIAQYSVLRMN
ncbi:MAG: polyprenyl synthetase family protein [Fimbriimonas sp.]|nr:polyprenyl synthetase family protein [Fimbriimonas sp.]